MRQPFRPATCQDVTDFSLLLLVVGVKQMFQHLLLKKNAGVGDSPITTMLTSSPFFFFLFFNKSNANVKPLRPTANQASAPGRIIK